MCSFLASSALNVVAEFIAQQQTPRVQKLCDAQAKELALFGNSVACVHGICSNCGESRNLQNCNCRAWTCYCALCCQMRTIYRQNYEVIGSPESTWPYQLPVLVVVGSSTIARVQQWPVIAFVSKECLVIFQAYDTNLALSRMRSVSARLACELVLFGTRVGCSQLPCSVCTMIT